MKKVVRNMSTPENKTFWQEAVRDVPQLESWPHWRRAGINVASIRQEPRQVPEAPVGVKK